MPPQYYFFIKQFFYCFFFLNKYKNTLIYYLLSILTDKNKCSPNETEIKSNENVIKSAIIIYKNQTSVIILNIWTHSTPQIYSTVIHARHAGVAQSFRVGGCENVPKRCVKAFLTTRERVYQIFRYEVRASFVACASVYKYITLPTYTCIYYT